jgi:hypothetical protein
MLSLPRSTCNAQVPSSLTSPYHDPLWPLVQETVIASEADNALAEPVADMRFSLPASPSVAVLLLLSAACAEVRRAGDHKIGGSAGRTVLSSRKDARLNWTRGPGWTGDGAGLCHGHIACGLFERHGNGNGNGDDSLGSILRLLRIWGGRLWYGWEAG